MSKKKKKKQKDNKPQLSKLDKFIYDLLLIIFIIIAILSINAFIPLVTKLSFFDESVIAATPHFSIIWSVPFLLLILLTPLEILIENQTKHKAIFGNKSIDYRRFSTTLRPIFGEERNKAITEKQRKSRNTKLIAWFVSFLILGAIGCLGLFGRDVLTTDGRIIEYSAFNNVREEYAINDISKVEYSTYYSSGGRYSPDTYDYSVEIYILNSDDSYLFDNQSFKNNKQDDISTSLNEMIRLKETVYKNKKITFNAQTELSKIAEHNKFSEKETKLLYKLFEREE